MRQGTGLKTKRQTFGRAVLRHVRYHVADALGFRVRPRKLRFAVTKRCNSQCLMCGAWKTQSDRDEITPYEIRTIAAHNRRFLARVSHVSVTGGEPSLRGDLVDFVRALSESFPRASLNINTNGFQTRRIVSMVEEILTFHPRLTVMVSLDGLGEVHNAVRGVPGVFPRVVETIDRLVGLRDSGARLKVEVDFVLTNHNTDQMLPVFHFCRERGIAFNPIYPIYGQLYDNEEAEIGLERGAARRFLADLAEIQKTDGSLVLRELAHQLHAFPRDFDCWAGRVLFLIEHDGRVFPNGGCPPEFCLGRLRDFHYRFGALLRSKQARRILRQLRTCRLCRIPCETMATLSGPEALCGYRKTCRPDAYPTAPSVPAPQKPAASPRRQRTP